MLEIVMGNYRNRQRKRKNYWNDYKKRDNKKLERENDKFQKEEQNLPELVINGHTQKNPWLVLSGRRIVNVIDNYFFEKIKDLNNHGSPSSCTFSDMELIKETRKGFASIFTWKCKVCNVEMPLSTENASNLTLDVNSAAVAGSVAVGIGHTQLQELCATMDVPPMSKPTYIKYHNTIGDKWGAIALEQMKTAAEEEKKIAIERTEVDENGIPILTVIADGSWAKRSYRTNYNSLSGMAAIVGFYTRKVIFMGVRNKFCTVCARSPEDTPDHVCFRNWSGSSSSMEADIIVEGFQRSLEMYDAKYGILIADGDSSVYAKIRAARPYTDLTVEKVECTNHLLRNFCKKIADAACNRKLGPILLRKKIADRISKFRSGVTKAICYRRSENISEDRQLSQLEKDIKNGLYHNLGQHKNCDNYFCDGIKDGEEDLVPLFKNCDLLQELENVFANLARHSRSLLKCLNTNSVEQFNSILCKFNGGKRINYCQRGSYQVRCAAAVVSFNSKMPISELHRNACGTSPGKYIKNIELKKRKRISNSNTNKTNKKKKARVCLQFEDKDYGDMAAQPDIDEHAFENKKRALLSDLSTLAADRKNIEITTRLQSASGKWLETRRKLLTASNFGTVCLRRPTTSCQNLVINLLYGTFECEAFRYGRSSEGKARAEFQQIANYKVTDCGLFIDEKLPFLGATPDGLIEDSSIIEIKCPLSAQALTPQQAITAKKFTLWNQNGVVNTNHKFYFQVQGQLHISNRRKCFFVLWTPNGLDYKVIERDDNFWKLHMEEKLCKFYMECVLPEIIDPRYTRKLPIREPESILEAQRAAAAKRRAKKDVIC